MDKEQLLLELEEVMEDIPSVYKGHVEEFQQLFSQELSYELSLKVRDKLEEVNDRLSRHSCYNTYMESLFLNIQLYVESLVQNFEKKK